MRRPADDNLPALTPAPRRRALLSPPDPAPLPVVRSSSRARGAASEVLAGLLLAGALVVLGASATLDVAPPASASSAAPSAAPAPVIAAAIASSPTLAPFPAEPLPAPAATTAPAAPISAPDSAAAPNSLVAAAPPAAPVPPAAASLHLPAPVAPPPQSQAAPPPAAPQAQPQQQQQRAPALVPVGGYITTEFGPGHAGIDIGAASGTPVVATAAGVVRAVYDWQVSYGRHVIVDHGGGWESLYAHLLNVALPPGQPVAAGQLIGWVGSTGRSTGPHLHFELRYRGRALAPLPYFQPR